MRAYEEYFKGKKITVAGLGILGRGVGDVAFLASAGADLVVTDLKNAVELQQSLDALRNFSNIVYRLGEHREEDFTDRDFILKGPTVPIDSPYIMRAKKAGTPIKMSASWFVELAGIPIVGVTGTRGKSTTTFMLYDIMKASGMDVLLGGNIRGVSTLSLLSKVNKNSNALFELDSWQCWGFGEAGLSPNVSVFTNFMSDHLDFYKGDSKTYLHDKAQIFLGQTESDTLIIGVQALPYIEVYKKKIRSHMVVAKPQDLALRVSGEHNQENAACALEAARALGIDDKTAKQTLISFAGVPGRLELVREVNDIRFYNDTTATIPEATIAGLKALRQSTSQNQNLILILGGADKGLDMSALVPLAQKTKKVILLAGTGTDTIKGQFPDAPVYGNLKEAVADAFASATAGDVILFSPAFASFGMFTNEFDRGDSFNELVQAL